MLGGTLSKWYHANLSPTKSYKLRRFLKGLHTQHIFEFRIQNPTFTEYTINVESKRIKYSGWIIIWTTTQQYDSDATCTVLHLPTSNVDYAAVKMVRIIYVHPYQVWQESRVHVDYFQLYNLLLRFYRRITAPINTWSKSVSSRLFCVPCIDRVEETESRMWK